MEVCIFAAAVLCGVHQVLLRPPRRHLNSFIIAAVIQWLHVLEWRLQVDGRGPPRVVHHHDRLVHGHDRVWQALHVLVFDGDLLVVNSWSRPDDLVLRWNEICRLPIRLSAHRMPSISALLNLNLSPPLFFHGQLIAQNQRWLGQFHG